MSFVQSLSIYSSYKDRKYAGTHEEWEACMAASSTLYVGNLSFFTTEEQIYQLFSMAGELKRVIMGLDRNNKTPCGFCFVEYYTRDDALACLLYLNGTKLDERIVRTDIDPGFVEGRQFGRGKSGGQVRDEHRAEYDSGRGGLGVRERERLEAYREINQRSTYDHNHSVPSGTQTSYGVDAFGRSSELRGVVKRIAKRERDDEGEGKGNSRFRRDRESDDE